MKLVLVGFDHKTTPVELRERFALAGDALDAALASLRDELAEMVIVSTCNRLEIYAAAISAQAAADTIVTFLAMKQGITRETLSRQLYCAQDADAALHLMRVASGLESLVLGETQILGQVAQALKQAQAANSVGAILTRLFNDALHAGKRAQSETSINRYSLSVSDAAVALLEQTNSDLSSERVLLVGAGEMAERAARVLHRRGVSDLNVVSRTDAHAERFAVRWGARAWRWDELPAALDYAEAVITALRVSAPALGASAFAGLSPKARRIVDIGVPRNVEGDAGVLPNVRLYDIDDLQDVMQAQHADQAGVVAEVESLCAEAAAAYEHWLLTRHVSPLITELREQAETVAALELERALRRLPELSADEQEIVAQMARRIVGKLLHAPTVALKERAAYGEHFDYSHAVRELFALGDERMQRE